MIGSFNRDMTPEEYVVGYISSMYPAKPAILAADVVLSAFFSLEEQAGINNVPYYGETTILVTAKDSAPFTGSATYTYRRIELQRIIRKSFENTIPLDITNRPVSPGHPCIYDILPDLSDYFGMNITENDVNNATLLVNPEYPAGVYDIAMYAKPNSMVFWGSAEFTIKPKIQKTNGLADVFVNRTFAGFDTPVYQYA